MTKKYKFIYFFFFGIFAVILLVASYEVKNNFSDIAFLEGKSRVFRNLGVHFEPQPNSVSLLFDNFNTYAPNAFSIKIKYDPKTIKITSVHIGDIWTSTNVLEKEIDNKNGIVTLSMGQGFDSQLTGKLMIANLNFQVLNPTSKSTTLSILPDSYYGVTKMKNLLNITGKSILLNINKNL
ncbi:hypothetical protein HYS03_00315 [Candidatus Woesebacteria bacterium]|nr:hypothetical protein [Candidatus Woesebacteria bacterium]QQG47415.1 MAG: hypothetical protein HY044_04810 [Candidatus Woesebacteria bacterium]